MMGAKADLSPPFHSYTDAGVRSLLCGKVLMKITELQVQEIVGQNEILGGVAAS